MLLAQTDNQLVGGICIGSLLVGFIWLIVFAMRFNTDLKHEVYIRGVLYSTHKAHRIHGINGNRVMHNGQWVQWICSLWRCYYDERDKIHRYFIITIDEINPAKITPITKESALIWIGQNAKSELAFKLIDEWIKGDT